MPYKVGLVGADGAGHCKSVEDDLSDMRRDYLGRSRGGGPAGRGGGGGGPCGQGRHRGSTDSSPRPPTSRGHRRIQLRTAQHIDHHIATGLEILDTGSLLKHV